MKCKACDADMSDREAGKMDNSTGVFLDLCGRCASASERAIWREEHSAEVEALPAKPPTCVDPLEAFERAVHRDGHWHRWGEGLGLMGPMKRRIHLYNKALSRFLGSLENGDRLTESLDYAFQKVAKRNPITGRTFDEDMTANRQTNYGVVQTGKKVYG
jgi:hypothetical protein